ncbi:hypothetical protein GHT06_008007 [Daphnia sinensis]|uniref:Transmembrane protein n=1 Tax=Daphnia sinensis TaxID=1820382 RepID=A0AAD5Q1N0_9CRUS|nr:hypothetical protein GHT06_008007 [Daphnia sinensis]
MSDTPTIEKTSIAEIEKTALPVTEETAIPMTEQATVPTIEMDNDESNESELVPDPDVPASSELCQGTDDFLPVMKRNVEAVNATFGVLVFFTQLWALLVSSGNVDIDPSGFLVGIYLVMLPSFGKFEKVTKVDLTRYLIAFAMMLGAMLIALHFRSVSVCENCDCTTISSSPVPLDLSKTKNFQWLNQQIFIKSLMMSCGIWLVIVNGFFLGVLVFYRPKVKSC